MPAAITGHYHDPLGTYGYCADPHCPRVASPGNRTRVAVPGPQRAAQRQPGPSCHLCTCTIAGLPCMRHMYSFTAVIQEGA